MKRKLLLFFLLSITPCLAEQPTDPESWTPKDYCDTFTPLSKEQWIGKTFIFMPTGPIQVVTEPSKYTNKQLAPEEYRGKKCKVLGFPNRDVAQVEILGTGKTAYVWVEGSGETGSSIMGLCPEWTFEAARKRFLGRDVWTVIPIWARFHINQALAAKTPKPAGDTPIDLTDLTAPGTNPVKVNPFTHFKVSDVTLGESYDRPIRLNLLRDDGRVMDFDLNADCFHSDRKPFYQSDFYSQFSDSPPQEASHSTPEQWAAIQKGQVLPGMTVYQTYLSFGPRSIVAFHDPNLIWEFGNRQTGPMTVLCFDEKGILKSVSNDESPVDALIAKNRMTQKEIDRLAEEQAAFSAIALTREPLKNVKTPMKTYRRGVNSQGKKLVDWGAEGNQWHQVTFWLKAGDTPYRFWTATKEWFLTDTRHPETSYLLPKADADWTELDEPMMVPLSKNVLRMVVSTHGGNGWGASLTSTSLYDIDLSKKEITSYPVGGISRVESQTPEGVKTLYIEVPMVNKACWTWIYHWDGKQWIDDSPNRPDLYKGSAEEEWKGLAYRGEPEGPQDDLAQKLYNYALAGGPASLHLPPGPPLHYGSKGQPVKIHKKKVAPSQ